MADVRQPGLREVLLVAAAVVLVVMLAAGATALLPGDGQAVVFHTPLLIVVLHRRDRARPVADPPPPRGLSAGAMTGPLERRAADLARLADERWDLLVVGGGIVGAGALLDAASRGLKVALVEQDDIAAGTSSRSSRLIHGGLRYLQQGEVGPRPRGARRARPAPAPGAAPRPPGGVPVPDLRAAGFSRARSTRSA